MMPRSLSEMVCCLLCRLAQRVELRECEVVRHWALLFSVWGGVIAMAGPLACIAEVRRSPDDQSRTALASRSPQIVDWQFGFGGSQGGGLYKLGYWSPVRVVVRGAAGAPPTVGRLEVVVPDDDGVSTVVTNRPNRPVEIVADGETIVWLNVKIGVSAPTVTVRLIVDDGVVDTVTMEATAFSDPEQQFAISEGMPVSGDLILEIGTTSTGIAEAYRLPQGNDRSETRRFALLSSSDELPPTWQSYEGVDGIVISGANLDFFQRLTAESAQIVALRRWVERGGRLVIFAAGGRADLLSRGGPLCDLLPGEYQEDISADIIQELEQFAQSQEPLLQGESDRSARMLVIPKLANVSGQIICHAGRDREALPLVIRSRLGFGELVFAGFDVTGGFLRSWGGRPRLIQAICGWGYESETEVRGRSGRVTIQSFDDMTGAIRHFLSTEFSGVEAIPFGWVVVAILGYLLLIGPIDYFLVRRVLKRMEATWITFPLTVLLVSVAAWWTAQSIKGSQLRVNSAELVDVDVRTGKTRGVLWGTLYSPQPSRFNLGVEPTWPDGSVVESPEVLLSWLGLPGGGIGGMQSGEQFGLFGSAYRYSPELDRIEAMPIQVWSTRSLIGRWHAEAPEPLIGADLRETDDGLVEGTVVNDAGLELSQVRLFYRSWAWNLGSLAENGAARIDRQVDPVKVKTMLTTGLNPPSDRLAEGARKITRLIEQMGFYQAVGALQTTGLTSDYQAWSDMSHLLTSDKAILVARCKSPRSKLKHENSLLSPDEQYHVVIYRFLLPVDVIRE